MFSPESEGCLVVPAVFNTVVGQFSVRGGFDSYPLRQIYHKPYRTTTLAGFRYFVLFDNPTKAHVVFYRRYTSPLFEVADLNPEGGEKRNHSVPAARHAFNVVHDGRRGPTFHLR